MPDVQEVFRMATQKVRQDPGALERQWGRQRRAARNRKAGAIGLTVALVAAGVLAYALSRPSSHEPKIANQPPGTATGYAFLDLDTGVATSLPASLRGGVMYATSPDGTRLAYGPWPEPIGDDVSLEIYVGNVDGTDVHRIDRGSTPSDALGPKWSPDGTALVFQGRNGLTNGVGNLFVADLETGAISQVTDLPPGITSRHWFMSPSFSPDGRSILFNLPRENDPRDRHWDLWSVPAAGGEPSLVLEDAAHGEYSPDGASIAYLRAPRQRADFVARSIWIADADGSDPQRLEGGDDILWLRWSPDGSRITYEASAGIYVLDVATGTSTRVADGHWPSWFDDHTLIIEPRG